MDQIRELGTGVFARSIESRLFAARSDLLQPEPRAISHALAGSLFSMLDW